MRQFILQILLIFPLIVAAQEKKKYELYQYSFSQAKEYTIKRIHVDGVKNIQAAYVAIYSGLSIGQQVKIPGPTLRNAIMNLWKTNAFSDIQLFIKELDSVNIAVDFLVAEQKKLNGKKYFLDDSVPMAHNKAKNLNDLLHFKKGDYITPENLRSVERKIKKYYKEKGFYDIAVTIIRTPARQLDKAIKKNVDMPGYENLKIIVNKGKKITVQEYVFEGNGNLTDKKLRRSFKKMVQRKNKINIFASSKFLQDKYDEGKENLLKKYASAGYRDAKIVSDSVYKTASKKLSIKLKIQESNRYYFRNISWKGNTKFRSTLLDTFLGIKKGDVYNQTLLEERLFANPGGFDIQSLYMDDGYLFFNMQPVEIAVNNDSIDLEIRMNEGVQARNGKIYWTGNTKTNDRVILREIRTKPGDIFNRSEIQRTMRELAALGLFDPQGLGVEPKPNPADGTVDILYKVAEKPSDQIELSGGYGGNGINSNRPSLVGTAGISLNNFSVRKLWKLKTWNPVPTGDAQKLGIRAQSNGSSYQGYTFSFTEPWLGGKKPNQFSLSFAYTINNYGFKPPKDPNAAVFFNTSFNVGFGKRLKWPDDFFNLSYNLSVQKYRFKNLTNRNSTFGFPEGFNGESYNFSLTTNLTRSSVSDPIYPTSGNTFSLSLQTTPPYSFISPKDFSKFSVSNKYKFAEFYKIKFDIQWYTPIWKKLVLFNQVRTGFLGRYGKELPITFFERFQVGGAGQFAFNLAGSEIISQRGYDNYTISQAATRSQQGAPVYNKFTTELRYAVTQGQTATVYGLVFAEAGKSWTQYKKINPFELYRSVGVGVRLFMPMFGLVGLDYAYGFDWKNVPGNTKPTQLHFFIGQQF